MTQEKSTSLSDAGSLSTTFRRFAVRTTLVSSLFTAAVPAAAADGGNKAKITQHDRDLGDVSVKAEAPLSMREKKRRVRIREALLEHARGDLDRLEAASETGYSRELGQLQDGLTNRLKDDHSTVHDRVVFVDPEKLDVALSLGFAPDYAVETLLARQKVHISDHSLKLAGDKATSIFDSKFGVKTYSQDPTAITNLKDPKPEACVVIPSSEHALEVDIKGLSRQEQVDFTNRHESWHCLDSKYNLRHLDPAKIDAVKNGTLATHVNDRTALEIYATIYRKEALADVGGVGDMIRGGKGLDLLDNVSAWRATDTKDLQHLSSPVLQGLKGKINEMGLENFRKLNDAAAEKLYFDVTDTFGMTAKSLQMDIRFGSANQAGRKAYVERAKTDEDAARAMILMTYLVKPPPAHGKAGFTAAEQAVAGRLKTWDADRLLDDKAFETGRKITPVTIIKAYNALQEELRHRMKDEPDNKLYPLQATKLQQCFLTHARELDYVGVNAERGVDIVKAEPLLRAFIEPPTKTSALPVQNSG